MWRHNFKAFARWGLRQQRSPKPDHKQRDPGRPVVSTTSTGDKQQNDPGTSEKETCHDRGRFFPHRTDCSFIETIGYVGTILAVGLNLRLHTRRCPQDRDEDVRAPGESYCADAAPFSMCRLVHCFLLRFALAAPSQRAVQSILPTENTRTDTSAKTAAEDVLDRSKAPSKDVLDCSKADKDTTLPLAGAAVEQLEEVTRQYFATLEECKGARLLGRDVDGALDCFRKARALGSARASYNLGVCYENGTGVKADVAKAMEHYTEAAVKGHPLATYNLGVLYMEGHRPQGLISQSGVELLQKASSLGVSKAKTFMGQLHLQEGRFQEALPLLNDAAAAEDAEASFYLGLCFERGLGVTKDHATAGRHYAQAASKGHAAATEAVATLRTAASSRAPAKQAVAQSAKQADLADTPHLPELSRKEFETTLLPGYLRLMLPALLASTSKDTSFRIPFGKDEDSCPSTPHQDVQCQVYTGMWQHLSPSQVPPTLW